jgi:hypothetical protein
MQDIFMATKASNQSLEDWNIDNVKCAKNMFYGAESFNYQTWQTWQNTWKL